jgi:diguanylate cyclase (GGDEF)-like protein
MTLEQLAARLRHPAEGLLHLDHGGRVLDADDGARRMLAAVASPGAELLDALHPADVAAGAALLLAGPAPQRRPVPLRLRVGPHEWRVVEAVATATAYGTVVLLLDVTDRHARALELARITEEVARLERTAHPVAPGGLAPGAGHDPLTGLLDRTAFVDVLTERACQERPTAVLLADVDGFADVCAEHGNGAGDVVLRSLAYRLAGAVTGGDLVARTGGDELAVVADDPGSHGRLAAYGEVLAITGAAPLAVHGRDLRITVSVGAAAGGTHFDPDELLARAGAALRHARALGGGRSVALGPAPASS